MTALKTATKSLLDQLKAAAATHGDVYVSIIPFVKDVNVGTTNYNATWIDWTDWDDNNGNCAAAGLAAGAAKSKSSCTVTDGRPGHRTTTTPGTAASPIAANSNAPSTGNYDTNVTAPIVSNTRDVVPGRAVQLLSARRHAAQLRLDRR